MDERCSSCYVIFRIFTSCPFVALSDIGEKPFTVLFALELAIVSVSLYFLAFGIMIYSVREKRHLERQLALLIAIIVSLHIWISKCFKVDLMGPWPNSTCIADSVRIHFEIPDPTEEATSSLRPQFWNAIKSLSYLSYYFGLAFV